VIGTKFRLAFEPGEQATKLIRSPALSRAVVIQKELALAFVVDNIGIGLR